MAQQQIGIYKIISPSGKIYIGQSWNIVHRFLKYKSLDGSKKQRILNNSFKKHGWKNHKFEIVQLFPEDIGQDTLDNYEIFYIEQYRESGYEMLNIKTGGRGGKLPKESIEKMLKTRGKWNHTEEAKKKISKSHKGITHSEQAKKKMSITRSKIILNTQTGIFYFGVREASQVYNLSINKLYKELNDNKKSNINFKYV